MRNRALSLICFVAILLFAIGTLFAAPRLTSFLGVNAHRFYHNHVDFLPIVETGVGWVRADFDWPFIQPSSKEEFDWGWSDIVAEKAQQSKIQVLGILSYVPAWANGGKGHNIISGDWSLWENYVYQTVSRYRGRIDAWEIWNEPNIFHSFGGDAALYAELVRRSYLVAKEANPNCIIVAGSTAGVTAPAGTGDIMGSAWLRGFYQNGGKEYCDAISVHPYQWVPRLDEGILKNDINTAKRIMETYQDAEKPLWLTEIGWSSNLGQAYSVTEEEQGKIIVQLYLTAFTLGVENVFWYDFRNDGTNPNEREDNFGLIKNDGTAKYAYYAFSNLISLVGEANALHSVELGEQVRAFKANFSEAQTVWALWSTEGPREVTIPIGIWKSLEKISLDGTLRESIDSERALVTLTLTENPIYLLGQGRKVGIEGLTLAPNPFLNKEVGSVGISYVLAEPSQVSIRIYNLAGKLIRNLIDSKSRDVGENADSWDGIDDRGRHVLSGPYVVVVNVDSEGKLSTAQKVMVVINH